MENVLIQRAKIKLCCIISNYVFLKYITFFLSLNNNIFLTKQNLTFFFFNFNAKIIKKLKQNIIYKYCYMYFENLCSVAMDKMV